MALRPDQHGGRAVAAPALPVERLSDPGGDQLTSPTTTGTALRTGRSGVPASLLRYRRAVRAVLLLVTAVLAAGCTTAVPGAPSAAGPTPLPPRPREVRLDGVDPCSLLSRDERNALGLESDPVSHSSYVALFRGVVKTCTMHGPSPEGLLLGISSVTSVGVERWTETDVAAELQPTLVADFPAYIVKPARYTDYCSVEIDVAPGQLLDIQFGGGSAAAPITQNDLCTRAGRSAIAAMAKLTAR